MNLLERLEYVLQEKGWTPADWTRRIPDMHRTHVNTIINRLKKNPNATIEIDTLEKLARAAEMPLEFFTSDRASAGDFVRVQEDKRYPSRGRAIAAARILGWSPEAIRRVQAIDDFELDPGDGYWMSRLEAEHRAAPAVRTLVPVRPKKRPGTGKSR